RAVALKELTGAGGDRDGRRMAALREARAASAVAHPGVVQVYDVLVDGDQAWIVMEALSGTTLAQAIRRDGPLPAGRIVSIGLGLLEVLEAIHGKGVIHGDLKPGNVMLTGGGRPVLTDFGSASMGDDPADVESAQIVGSPPYMAPETIRTGVRIPASDLFALGATLYEAAEGRRPFVDDDPVATLLSVLHHDPEPALGGTLLGRIIDGLLVKDPRHRLTAHEAYALFKEAESEVIRSTVQAVRAGARPSGPQAVEAA
ncbi:MAG TPA: serine/threonine-protein kinase, partial [Actinomycetes bacterium]|nr:serine/threonine-protein kinase [Actinomycetes bacterium]